jgi:hypothetical protein
MEVTLSWSELLVAYVVAALRQISNIKHGKRDRYGASPEDGFSLHVKGCLGEMAVAKALGIYWCGNLGDFGAADVGDLQVRTRSRHDQDLIVHPSDKDTDRFILVTGTGDRFVLQGWCYGEEAKLQAYWKDPAGGRPAYFVPKSALSPMGLLSRAVRRQRQGVAA